VPPVTRPPQAKPTIHSATAPVTAPQRKGLVSSGSFIAAGCALPARRSVRWRTEAAAPAVQHGAMEFIVWIVTGAAVGWLAFTLVGLNSDRGRIVSMVTGAVGALVGGKMLAPMFITAPMDTVSVPSIGFAAIAAGVLLVAGNVVQNRWGV